MASMIRGNSKVPTLATPHQGPTSFVKSTTFSWPAPLQINIRELKQRRQRRLWKCHLKSKFALPETLSGLFPYVYFVKCWQISLELNSKGLYLSSGKEKENCCFVFPSWKKPEIRHFHVVVVQWWQRNVQKSVMHVQSCYFANLNILVYCRSWCHCRRHCLSSQLIGALLLHKKYWTCRTYSPL